MLRTPLYEAHLRAGARIVPFAGYDMPVQYDSVIAEAKAVRGGVGMFDVSHMARLRLTGPEIVDALEAITVNEVSALADGRGHYSLLTNRNGGVVDDIILYRESETEFMMVVNAANHAKDAAWLRAELPESVTLEDRTDATAMIAVQGPTATETLAGLSPDGEAIRTAPMFGIVRTSIADVPVWMARSGYTGEDGFELVPSADDADRLWEALRTAGVAPCGLASRDTLRVEAGLPLYGHELSDELSPIAAGLGWVISKTKSFLGSEIIAEHRAQGTPTKLQGIRLASKRLLMPEMAVHRGNTLDGDLVGRISSGVYSPLLECGIGFAFLTADLKVGTEVCVDIRGKAEPAVVANKRFFKRSA
ncbi:MAG: glycine cleavage system aminomethyltransferase GcvT [Fimbriimonadaceae bacterium]|nr:glycine cleavage system aminomethyltransferase GcvT [Fimbriimonadaceae bacterium]